MKVTYLFPIFKNDDAKTFFKSFLSSSFFLSQKDAQLLIYVEKSDEKNLKALKTFQKKHSYIELFIENTSFDYNKIFNKAIKNVKGEVLLLGDLKVPNITTLFANCLKKYKSGANIVFIKKEHNPFKTFFLNILQNYYNFFIKIFTGKRDKINIISLGLYDKNVLEVFKSLPNKNSFLKNTEELIGFKSKTIFIEDKVPTYKTKFSQFSNSLKMVSAYSFSFLLFLACMITINTLFEDASILLNMFVVLVMVSLLITIVLIVPKHFYSIRNEIQNNVRNNIDKS